MTESTDLKPLLEALSDVSEDLAIELLAGFRTDEFHELGKSIERLKTAVNFLLINKIPIPYSVSELIRLNNDSQSH